MMYTVKELRLNEDIVVDVKEEMDTSIIDSAAAKAFPSVVGILSHHLPDDMAQFTVRGEVWRLNKREIKERGEIVFWGSGVIYECYYDDELNCFSSIIICPATLFIRTNGIEPSDIRVDVYLSDGKVCEGRVIACDFHYNLAAIRIQTTFQLTTATFKDLEDIVPINDTPIQQGQQSLRPHSTKFKISPGTNLITIARTFRPRNAPIVGYGAFSPNTFRKIFDHSELYCVEKNTHPEKKGGAVLNSSGEVIGLMFYKHFFLPINLVSTWWKNFKSCRQYHRPCLGMKIANLHLSSDEYLREVLAVFPDFIGGVVVAEVAEDSLAYSSGLRPEDVILSCDGILVRSSLELFEIVWSKVGIEYVHLDVWRARNGDKQKLSLKVEQTSADKMYQWEQTRWSVVEVAKTLSKKKRKKKVAAETSQAEHTPE